MNSTPSESPSTESRGAQPPLEAPSPISEAQALPDIEEVSAEPARGAAAGTAEPESEAGESPVNYDESALLEIEIDGTDYRLDVGRAGTALCISTRSSGTWSWRFQGEAKWQNNLLRCKAFDRTVLAQLGTALIQAADDSQS
jgi:hypothetical protein